MIKNGPVLFTLATIGMILFSISLSFQLIRDIEVLNNENNDIQYYKDQLYEYLNLQEKDSIHLTEFNIYHSLDFLELIQSGIDRFHLKLLSLKTIESLQNDYQSGLTLNLSYEAAYTDWLAFRLWMHQQPVYQEWTELDVIAEEGYYGFVHIEEKVKLVVNHD